MSSKEQKRSPMKALFSQLLEAALFNVNGKNNIVLVPHIDEAGATGEAARHRTGNFSIPDDLFPANCRVCRLPSGEGFLQSLAGALPTDQATRIFLIPPLMSRRDLSDSLRAQFPFMNLGEIILRRVVEVVVPGSLVGVLLPGSF